MPIDPTTIEIPTAEAIAAYQAVKPMLDALPEEALYALRFPAPEATARGLWVAGNAERDRERFIEMYKDPPLEAIDSLEQRALAVKGAELAAPDPDTPAEPPDLERGRELRKKHLKVLDAVFFGDAGTTEKLEEIRSGRGNRDLGSDLIDLSALEAKHWPRVLATGLISADERKELDPLGAATLRWAGRSDTPAPNPREAEQRAWTHMAQAYNLVRDYAFVLYRDDPDGYARDYPALSAPRD